MKMTEFSKILTMCARLHFPNWFLMILCTLGAFSDFSKLNTFSDIWVGGVPQRAVFPHLPLCQWKKLKKKNRYKELTSIRIGRELNNAPRILKGTKYMLRYKDKISAQCKKLVLYHVENDGPAFRCHSKFACAAITFRVVVITGKIYNTIDFTLGGFHGHANFGNQCHQVHSIGLGHITKKTTLHTLTTKNHTHA